MSTLEFESAWIAGVPDCEQGCLVRGDGCVLGVLLRVADPTLPPDRQGWYLETGFGPCRAEGVLFADLAAAERWIRERLPTDWHGPNFHKDQNTSRKLVPQS